MMKYVASNIGMPRIGRRRELKFAIEKYWRNEVSQAELIEVAQQIVTLNNELQVSAGINQVPVNDFTYYDRMLDMCCLLSVIPSRFNGLEEKSFTDSYFRFARGEGSIPAMEMTKWFDTNYHYIVPEIEDATSPAFNSDFFANQIFPAGNKAEHKFTVIGPITFLSLAKASKEGADKFSIYGELKAAYDELLGNVVSMGYANLQIEEPALGTDLNVKQKKLFNDFYGDLKDRVPGLSNVLLSSYFGNVEDNIKLAKSAQVDCVHLDIFTDESNLSQLESLAGKFTSISLGVISGRNIWKINLNEAIEMVKQATASLSFETIYIAPTTSLQHVPYSLSIEEKMPSEVVDWLAFAEEKISEIEILTARLNNSVGESDSRVQAILTSNAARASSTLVHNPAVGSRLSDLTQDDYKRNSTFDTRQDVQQAHFKFPKLPTTTIGSFPQTAEIRKARADFTAGNITQADYKGFMEQAIVECIEKQEELGIDVLVHGEPERNDMVQYFGELLSGFTFTSFGWVQSYGTRCVKPPVIYGDVERPNPMTVDWAKFAQSKTQKK